MRLRKADSTVTDLKLLLTRQPATNVDNLIEFKEAVRLFKSNKVANYNYEELVKSKQSVARSGARHLSATSKKISPDDFSGLQH